MILLISNLVQKNGQKLSLRRCLWIRLPSSAPLPRRSLAERAGPGKGVKVYEFVAN